MGWSIKFHWVGVAPLKRKTANQVGVHLCHEFDISCADLALHLLLDLLQLIPCQALGRSHTNGRNGLLVVHALDIFKHDDFDAIQAILLRQKDNELWHHGRLQGRQQIHDFLCLLHFCDPWIILHCDELVQPFLFFELILDHKHILCHFHIFTLLTCCIHECLGIGHHRPERRQHWTICVALDSSGVLRSTSASNSTHANVQWWCEGHAKQAIQATGQHANYCFTAHHGQESTGEYTK